MKKLTLLLFLVPTLANAQTSVEVPTKAYVDSQFKLVLDELKKISDQLASLDARVAKLEQGGVPICTFSFDIGALDFPPEGGTANLFMTTQPNCQWGAVSNVSWMVIKTGASGVGPGPVVATIDANTGGPRNGNITAGNTSFQAKQAGTTAPFTINVTPLSQQSGAGATVRVSWTNIPTPTKGDWLGIYVFDQPTGNSGFAMGDQRWAYVDCKQYVGQSQGVPVPTGTCDFNINGLASNRYNVRLFANESYTEIGRTLDFVLADTPPMPIMEFFANEVTTIPKEGLIGLEWDAPETGMPIRYHVYTGQQSGIYGAPFDVGLYLTYAVPVQPGQAVFANVSAVYQK